MNTQNTSSNRFKVFTEKIERRLVAKHMGLPSHSQTSHLRFHNHDYGRIRATLREVRQALEFEAEVLNRLANAKDLAAEYRRVSDEIYDDDSQPLQGLDLGVASAVLSLSAIGCVTFSSCNGGSFGDFHHEKYPLITFYAKPENAPLLIKAAKEAGVGIRHVEDYLMVWANDIRHMLRFGQAVLKSRKHSPS
jgi:hypothetical protein